jgi:hypothetical protein
VLEKKSKVNSALGLSLSWILAYDGLGNCKLHFSLPQREAAWRILRLHSHVFLFFVWMADWDGWSVAAIVKASKKYINICCNI